MPSKTLPFRCRWESAGTTHLNGACLEWCSVYRTWWCSGCCWDVVGCLETGITGRCDVTCVFLQQVGLQSRGLPRNVVKSSPLGTALHRTCCTKLHGGSTPQQNKCKPATARLKPSLSLLDWIRRAVRQLKRCLYVYISLSPYVRTNYSQQSQSPPRMSLSSHASEGRFYWSANKQHQRTSRLMAWRLSKLWSGSTSSETWLTAMIALIYNPKWVWMLLGLRRWI